MRRWRHVRKAATTREKINSLLEAPVKLKQGGEAQSMPAYEATLRQHVKKALVDQSLPSIKFVIGEAEKHGVIEQPPPPPEIGGVYIVPKWLPEEAQREIFEYHPEDGQLEPMSRIWGIIRKWVEILKAELKENEQKQKQ